MAPKLDLTFQELVPGQWKLTATDFRRSDGAHFKTNVTAGGEELNSKTFVWRRTAMAFAYFCILAAKDPKEFACDEKSICECLSEDWRKWGNDQDEKPTFLRRVFGPLTAKTQTKEDKQKERDKYICFPFGRAKVGEILRDGLIEIKGDPRPEDILTQFQNDAKKSRHPLSAPVPPAADNVSSLLAILEAHLEATVSALDLAAGFENTIRAHLHLVEYAGPQQSGSEGRLVSVVFRAPVEGPDDRKTWSLAEEMVITGAFRTREAVLQDIDKTKTPKTTEAVLCVMAAPLFRDHACVGTLSFDFKAKKMLPPKTRPTWAEQVGWAKQSEEQMSPYEPLPFVESVYNCLTKSVKCVAAILQMADLSEFIRVGRKDHE